MHRRPLLALFVALGLAATASACKKKDDAGTAGSGSSATGDIVIGHYASMTGNTAHFGQDTDKAARLAAEQINEAGGVLGRKLKVVTLDTRGDGADAANAVTRLIDVEKSTAILGEVASSLSLQGGPIAQRRKIPMVSPSSTNPKVTQIGDYVFRVCYIDPFQGKVMAHFARNTLKLDKVAILKDVKNDYSKGLAEAFQKAFLALGGTIAVEQSYSAGDTDFSAQVTAIKGSAAQAIWVPGYYSEVASIARTAQRLGLKVPLLGGDGWDAPELFGIAGDSLNGSYFSNHFAPDQASPKAQKFVADFTAKYGQPPTGLGALGYDGVLVIADALKRANSAEPAKLRDALAATKGLEAVTGTLTMDKERNPEKSVVVLKIDGGKAKYETLVQP
ncbi:MAG: Branched-chain amino acid transporter, amino acid-binding protein [Polyangiaceae bacterium]|jgi:branched-chain amino acid transport system substrate-binding protein|nr:Branched-chain amino acid transporter, amino acid-binding protein [Polyangiaceae bacterium]